MSDARPTDPQGSATGPPTAARVAAALRDEITTGALPPGTRLKDAYLAHEHGVSRNTLRDAVRQLESDGLVVSRRNAGNSVHVLSESDAHDIYCVRRTLEAAGIDASTSSSPELLDELSGHVEASRRAEKDQRWADVGTSSLRLHQSIVALLKSPRFDVFFSNIVAQLRLVFAVMDDEAAFQLQWVERDEALCALLVSGDRRQAHLELREYLADSEAQVIDAIRKSSSG